MRGKKQFIKTKAEYFKSLKLEIITVTENIPFKKQSWRNH